ncbi:acyltransferase [Acidipila sp. EB88]|uniref:acyltransferase family protein n=1 Tax=Acidipila sp. EB88 TaxID=2305226 RepID=UPI00131551D5|nr:acyltransferase [Acidipila sp. EB88]
MSDLKSSGLFHTLARLPHELGRPVGRVAYIPQIDGLRFLAIFVVFVWHSSLRASRYADRLQKQGIDSGTLYRWFPHGEIGVDLFFFISGLVIAQSFLYRKSKWSFRDFYTKRFMRIYPPYILSLLGCFAVLGLTHHVPEGGGSFASNIPLLHSFAASAVYVHSLWFNAPSRLNPPMWSLEIEIQFYLIVPFLMLAYLRLKRQAARMAVLAAVSAAAILVVASFHLHGPMDHRFRIGLLAYAPYFLAGIATADLSKPGCLLNRIKPGAAYDAVMVVALVAFTGFGLWLCGNDAHPQGFWLNVISPLAGLVIVSMIYLGALYGHVSRAVLGLPWIALIGTMCYSIYLTHIAVVQGVSDIVLSRLHLENRWLIWGIWLPSLAVAVFGVGLVFYLLVERPLMNGGAKVARHDAGKTVLPHAAA